MVEFVVVALATAEESRAAGNLSRAAAVHYVGDVVDMSCALLSAETRWKRPAPAGGARRLPETAEPGQ